MASAALRTTAIIRSQAYKADTKTNVQTYLSPEEVASWLQRKKEGRSGDLLI